MGPPYRESPSAQLSEFGESEGSGERERSRWQLSVSCCEFRVHQCSRLCVCSASGSVGLGAGPWANLRLGRLPLRVFSVGKFICFPKKSGIGTLKLPIMEPSLASGFGFGDHGKRTRRGPGPGVRATHQHHINTDAYPAEVNPSGDSDYSHRRKSDPAAP